MCRDIVEGQVPAGLTDQCLEGLDNKHLLFWEYEGWEQVCQRLSSTSSCHNEEVIVVSEQGSDPLVLEGRSESCMNVFCEYLQGFMSCFGGISKLIDIWLNRINLSRSAYLLKRSRVRQMER